MNMNMNVNMRGRDGTVPSSKQRMLKEEDEAKVRLGSQLLYSPKQVSITIHDKQMGGLSSALVPDSGGGRLVTRTVDLISTNPAYVCWLCSLCLCRPERAREGEGGGRRRIAMRRSVVTQMRCTEHDSSPAGPWAH